MLAFYLFIGSFACQPGPRTFPAEYAEAQCRRQEECALGDYEEDYSSFRACRRAEKAAYEAVAACHAECRFDAEGAARCLDELESDDCDDWIGGDRVTDCDEVWQCSDDEVEEVEACLR